MRTAILLAIMAILFVLVNYKDYAEYKLQLEEYCSNVAAGRWPDYESKFLKECGKGSPPKYVEAINI